MTDIDLFGLKGAHVVITGASGGIGIATVKLFDQLGARISAHRNTQQDVQAGTTNTLNVIQADATNEADVERFYNIACEKFGAPDVLVVSHGIFETKECSIAEMSVEQFRRTIDVNLTGTFLFVKHFLRNITSKQRPPAIIIIGSTSGRFGEAKHADYSASKSALHYGFLLSLKNEIVKVHPQGRANVVAPGWVSTPMALESLKDPAIRAAAMATTPMKKIAQPEDITGTIAYLASWKLSGHVTGEVITISGGLEGRQVNAPSEIE